MLSRLLPAVGVGAGVVAVAVRLCSSRGARSAAKRCPCPTGTMVGGEGITYPEDHWCRTVLPPSDPRFVAVLRVSDDTGGVHEALVLIRGAAGYQCVVALTDRTDPMRLLNRLPTQHQYEAVLLAASQVAAAFLSAGIFPQVELLCNNSHTLRADRTLQLGVPDEPFVLHTHIIGRGDPDRKFLGGVPLRCWPPHDVMVPRQRHVPWGAPDEVGRVASALATHLRGVPLHPSVAIQELKE
eukprot:Sspe_Gene.92022::Locus_63741_Transcript_1_1_Confidence_1.000_Length_781::g.92022::m.92022